MYLGIFQQVSINLQKKLAFCEKIRALCRKFGMYTRQEQNEIKHQNCGFEHSNRLSTSMDCVIIVDEADGGRQCSSEWEVSSGGKIV